MRNKLLAALLLLSFAPLCFSVDRTEIEGNVIIDSGKITLKDGSLQVDALEYDSTNKEIDISTSVNVSGAFFASTIAVQTSAAPLAPIHVGNRNDTNSADSMILISREVDDTTSGNAHAFSDSSRIDRAGTIGYNSYDARTTIIGSNDYDHYAGMQESAVIGTSGRMTNYYSFISIPQVNVGTVTNRYGVDIWDVSGTGLVDRNIGLRIRDMNFGTDNISILQEGTNARNEFEAISYFANDVGIGTRTPVSKLQVTFGKDTVMTLGNQTLNGTESQITFLGRTNGGTLLNIDFALEDQAFFVVDTQNISDLIIINTVNGDIGFGVIPNEALTLENGVISLKETTAPSATATYGKIWTESNNELFFQSGDGNTHLLHGDAFSNLWFHSVSKDTVAISSANTFTLIDSFENVGEEDDLSNVLGSTTTSSMIVGADGEGKYNIAFHSSITSAGGASSEMIISAGITLNTTIDVTGATNATPIVVTSVAHGLLNGDMVTIAGGTTNTAVNGDWVVTSKTSDNYTLVDLSGSDSVGNGVYDASSGDVTIKYPGNLLLHRVVSQNDLGVGGVDADVQLLAGDDFSLYVANIGATRDLEISAISLALFRIGD